MDLLRNPEDRGYPAEYLFSRVRGRRAALIKDWRPLVFEGSPFDALAGGWYKGFVKDHSPTGVWRNLEKEYQWVFGQMNEPLREVFRPFFLYSELRTMFICLRHGKDKKAGVLDDLLGVSLLSDEIKRVLSPKDDVPSAVAGIERVFLSHSGKYAGLAKAFETDGLRGFEQHLTNTCLSVTVQERLQPLMKRFFIRLIDARNIMGVFKYLKLGLKVGPDYIKGGSVPEERLIEIVSQEDVPGVVSLVREFTGVRVESPDSTQIEIALYKGITRFLKREGRDPLGVGIILDYLWQCSIEAMNLSVLFHGRELERDAVTAELVR